MNSLYGRFGMRDIENKLVITNRENAEILMNKKNIVFYSEINDKIILKYNNNVNKDIFNQTDFSDNTNDFLNIIKQRGRGVKSLKKIYEKEFLINSSPNSNVGVSNGEDDTSSINSETRSVLSYIESDGFIKIIKRELNKLVKFKFYNHRLISNYEMNYNYD